MAPQLLLEMVASAKVFIGIDDPRLASRGSFFTLQI
jgi:hypothetical protein